VIPPSLFAIGALLTVLALYVLRARPKSKVNRWFTVYTLTLTGWVFGIAGLHTNTNLDLWSRTTFACASLIPWSFLAFTHNYPSPGNWPPRRLLQLTLSASAVFAVLSIATPLLVHDVSLGVSGPTRKPGLLYPIFALYMLVGCLLPLGLFLAKWRQARGQERAQLQYLGTGLLILGVGALSVNLVFPLITGRSAYSWFGPYFILPLVALVGHAIIRHRLLDLRIFVSRGLAYAVAMVIASVALVAGARLVSPTWEIEALSLHHNLVIVTVIAIAMFLHLAQRFISRLVDPYLYRGIDQPLALRGATRRLSRLMQPTELSSELEQILTEVLVPESFTFLVKSFETDAFERLSGGSSPTLAPEVLAALSASEPTTSVTVVNPSAEDISARRTHSALHAAGIEVLVTLGRRGQLLGILLAGPRRSGDAYFKNDLVFIESLADLASIALDNALLYRQRIHMLEYSERLLESLDSAVVAIDVAGRITSFNPAATKLLNLSDEYQGALMHVLPSEVGWALVLAVSGGWHPREVEVTIDHVVRGTLHVILSTATLHDDEKRVSGALVVVTDLSAVKALERNQRRVEHLAIMASFYAGIAHEIRNPLAAISNLISMLPDRFDDPEYRDTAVRLLPMEVARIVRLADRLRLMAPSEGGKLSVVSIPPLLHDIVAIHSPTAHEQQVKIELRCPDELPKIQGDPGQLVQLFVNLLRNAVEAMPDGGIVTIEADHFKGRAGEDFVIVRVLDEGIGIDPTVRPKIFDPFFTTKPSGTGLGLSICREIADFHRARLALLPRSILDGGTVAEVEFPSLSLEPSAR
jgi:signal transduction histidine kinase